MEQKNVNVLESSVCLICLLLEIPFCFLNSYIYPGPNGSSAAFSAGASAAATAAYTAAYLRPI